MNKTVKDYLYAFGWKTKLGFAFIFIATFDAQVYDVVSDDTRTLLMSIGVLLAGVGARSAIGKLIEAFKETKNIMEEKL